MAEPKFPKFTKNSARRILADSANAKHRFGFAGERGSPITSAPKLSDLWFIEFKTVTGDEGVALDISALAKSVSHISLMTSVMPIDQYGKRIYVPTRVDFPEVTIQMYDTIDGKMFDFSREIYSKFFKNQDAVVTPKTSEDVLTGVGKHGRKLPSGYHEYYHQSFEKISIYHFFGNLETPGDLSADYMGKGTIQKIELINPLVTGLTFSSSDYSISELRTVDMTIQPENVRIEKVEKVNFPNWMTEGLDYLMDELVSLKTPAFYTYPKDLENSFDGYDTVNNFSQLSPNDPRNKDPFGDKWKTKNNFTALSKTDPRNQDPFKDKWKTKNTYKKYEGTDPTEGNEMAKIDYEKRDKQDALDDKRKLADLMRLYNAQVQNPTDKGIEEMTAELKANIGVIDAARLSKFTKKDGEEQFEDGWNFTDNPTADTSDIPGFGPLGDSNPVINSLNQGAIRGLPSYSPTNFGSSMINELVSSFFGNRSFNMNNTNNSLFGGLTNLLSTSAREISGSKITDGIASSKKSSTPTSTVLETNNALPDIVENIYKRGSESSFSPGVSKIIKYNQS
jgi:hypothetical protein